MPLPNLTPRDMERANDRLLKEVDTGTEKTLRDFAAVRTARADRLAAARERLESALGADHPRVRALEARTVRARKLLDAVDRTVEDVVHRPRVGPHEWTVFGRVRHAEGKPAAGVRVRVFDKDRRFDDLLGDTRTDAEGRFSAIYHERDFAESGENLPELYVRVEDERGKVLYSSESELRMQAGRVEYFDITLE
jgi:hypothetical protein